MRLPTSRHISEGSSCEGARSPVAGPHPCAHVSPGFEGQPETEYRSSAGDNLNLFVHHLRGRVNYLSARRPANGEFNLQPTTLPYPLRRTSVKRFKLASEVLPDPFRLVPGDVPPSSFRLGFLFFDPAGGNGGGGGEHSRSHVCVVKQIERATPLECHPVAGFGAWLA